MHSRGGDSFCSKMNDKQNVDSDVEKETDDDGHRAVKRKSQNARRRR
jgi:hypothetical protein